MIRSLAPGSGLTEFLFECSIWLLVVALAASPLANKNLRNRLIAAIPH
jgi:hypothetical protein